jgi:hypothetical protein
VIKLKFPMAASAVAMGRRLLQVGMAQSRGLRSQNCRQAAPLPHPPLPRPQAAACDASTLSTRPVTTRRRCLAARRGALAHTAKAGTESISQQQQPSCLLRGAPAGACVRAQPWWCNTKSQSEKPRWEPPPQPEHISSELNFWFRHPGPQRGCSGRSEVGRGWRRATRGQAGSTRLILAGRISLGRAVLRGGQLCSASPTSPRSSSTTVVARQPGKQTRGRARQTWTGCCTCAWSTSGRHD